MNRQKKAYLYAAMVIIFWSTVATAFKIGLRYLDPPQLLLYASFTSFLVLLVTAIAGGKIKQLLTYSGRDYLNSALLGLLNPFLYYLVLFNAYSLLPAQVAQPLNMVWPIVLVFLSGPLLGQRIGYKSYIALAVSFIGVMFISSQGEFISFAGSDTRGIILALGSSLFWALYFILNLKDKREAELKLLLNFFFATLVLIIYNLILGNTSLPSFKALAAASYIGVFEMGLSFLLWMKALEYSRSSGQVAGLIYLVPFLSLVFIYFVLGESIFLTTFVGLLLIIAGIVYQKSNFKLWRRRD